MRGPTAVLVALVLAGGVSRVQADPGFKNVALVAECRRVMERVPDERSHYLKMELFNYEMSFHSKLGAAGRADLEEKLHETCNVVSRTGGLGPVEVALLPPERPESARRAPYSPAPVFPGPVFLPRAASVSVAPLAVRQAPLTPAVTVSTRDRSSAWSRPLFEASDSTSSSLDAPLRRMLHIQ